MRLFVPTFLLFILFACKSSSQKAGMQGQKVSQFERAGMCDFLIDKAGVYHAVFQESPDNGKPIFIYYSSSTNKGASWSKPVNISNDNTGNGAGYPRILQDGNGVIYAIWKRYGNTASSYPTADAILDGSGGYELGTVFYKVLNGGGWSNAVQLNETERIQDSWFATVTPGGKLCVFWTQLGPAGMQSKQNMWYYCDFLRMAVLNGTAHGAFNNLNTPAAATYPGGAPPQNGANNLSGYVDANNLPHLVYEDKTNDLQQVKYYDGKSARAVYSYAKYSTHNTFNNPPHLLVDERGADHIIFLPGQETLESEQLWDYNTATNQANILTQIQKKGVKISGFQACQGPGGQMAVVVEAGGYSENTEAFGLFYQNGVWKNIGLTNNAAKEKFFYKEFVGLAGYNTYLASLTRYNSQFASIAFDATGKKSMLMTISAYWTSGGLSTSSPSVLFSPIDK